MTFNSLEFALFFPLVTALYFLLPYRRRVLLLLAASCVFYMAFVPAYILILLFTIAVDYCAGLLIASAAGHRRKLFLAMSLGANIGILAVFKYYNFLNGSLGILAAALGLHYPLPVLDIVLPIGLSFHTFQAMSYTIEVYRGRYPSERDPLVFATYVMFYPQLVAGPIERPQHLLPQFRERHDYDDGRLADGLKLMAWGLFKKAVVADHLAILVDNVYRSPTDYRGFPLACATVLFAWQIYCDFSGYTDMARGAARAMGFRLVENFARPYAARSVAEFWHRWHISLSSWFRDYVYIPLGGNRVPPGRWAANVMCAFLLSGLWHGADWKYVIWGALNGAYLVLGRWSREPRSRLARALGLDNHPALLARLQQLAVFLLICYAWIFFRARTMGEAGYVATHVFLGWSDLARPAAVLSSLFSHGDQVLDLLAGLAGMAVLGFVSHLQERGIDPRALLAARPPWQRWACYYALATSILLFGVFGPYSRFIYFQF